MAEKQIRETDTQPATPAPAAEPKVEPAPEATAAPAPKPPRLRVMARADYAVQAREHTMAQPETWLVLDGDAVIGEFDTDADAAAYVEAAG